MTSCLRLRPVLAAILLLPLGCAPPWAQSNTSSSTPPDQPAGPVVDLVVDSNRNGVLDLHDASEEAQEDSFDNTHGAIFLANLDDDDHNGVDAQNTSVDGDADVQDLSPMMVAPWAAAPAGTTAVLAVEEAGRSHAHLFKVSGPVESAASYTLVEDPAVVPVTLEEVRAGVSFALEGLEPTTSTSANAWDGTVALTLTMLDAAGASLGQDRVVMHVAPVVFQFNTAPTNAIFFSNGGFETAAMSAAVSTMGGAHGFTSYPLNLSGHGLEFDQWAQDFFDIASMTRPGPDGSVVGMKLAMRSAQPDRPAGGVTTVRLLGPDMGALWVHGEDSDPYTLGYSMNSFGDWDVIPPYTKGPLSFPMGRNIWGQGAQADVQPDPAFVDMVKSQRVQPHFNVDTSFLVVGHVDEIVSFVKTNTPRGWGMLAASPLLARQMFLDLSAAGHGSTELFVGKSWLDENSQDYVEIPANITVDAALADMDLMASNQDASIHVDDAVFLLQGEIGLADDEVTHMPFLMTRYSGSTIAWQPGTVNLLHANGAVLIPDPFGPLVGGVDPFKEDLKTRLGALGLDVSFVDDWDLWHREDGEVHCGSNAARQMDMAWWQSWR